MNNWMRLWLAALLLSGSLAMAAEFSPTLEYELTHAGAGEFVSAIIILESPVDIRVLDERLHADGASLARRHQEVLNALHYNADMTQPEFQKELDIEMSKGRMEGYTAYWIENLFVVSAAADWIESLKGRSDIKYVTENFVAELIEPIVSDDPDAGRIPRNPLDAETTTPGQNSIQATRVNRELGITGQGVLVATLDTGVDGNHPALASRWRGLFAPAVQCWRDALSAVPTNFPTDTHSHGTHVTGTIAGRQFTGADTITVGSAPNARWIANNAINQGVSGAFNNDVIDAYQWFANPDGDINTLDDLPDVIQNSWGVFTGLGYAQCFDLWNTVILNCEAAGPVITWSAGNEAASGLRSPAIYSINAYQIFSVGAVDAQDGLAPYPIATFSSRGPTPCAPAVPNNIKPEISAPGVNVFSSIPGGGYSGTFSGTSMAGPHVAGVVALMREACPNCDHITIKDAIMTTALDQGTVGEDNTYGHGMIDAYAAVLAVANIGRISGTVTDFNSGLPLTGAKVRINSLNKETLTNALGQYIMITDSGTFSVDCSLFGFVSQTINGVVVPEGDTAFVNVALVPAATGIISGTVTSCLGGPSAGAIVEIVGMPVPADTADAAGFYSITLPQGIYDIRATGNGCGSQTFAAVVIGSNTTQNFNLPTDPRYSCTLGTAGYQICEDGDEDGPLFDWLEIAPLAGGPGTATGIVGDDAGTTRALPFTFRLFGSNFTSVWIASNGFLSFSTTSTVSGNVALPSAAQGFAVMPFWDDLIPTGGQIATYYHGAENAFIIEWYRNGHFGAGTQLETFQVWLYDVNTNPDNNGNSQLRFKYLDVTTTNSATIGIQSGTTAYQYGFNNVYEPNAQGLQDNRVIAFGGEAPALAVIDGLVTDFNSGLPVSSATVLRTGSTQSTLTNASGLYSLRVLAGTHSLTISKTNYATLVVDSITVAELDTVTANASLVPFPAMSGTVFDGNTSLPLSGVTVARIGSAQTAITDSLGRYSLVFASGTYSFRFTKASYASDSLMNLTFQDGDISTGNDITLLPLPRITGTVTDATTLLPVSGALVQRLGSAQTATTNAAGFYTMTVTAGTFSFRYSKTNYTADTLVNIAFVNGSVINGDLLLVPNPKIRGTVVDAATVLPLSGVLVTRLGSAQTTTTDAQGMYEMQFDPGTYSFQYSKPAFDTDTLANVTFVAGDLQTQNMALNSSAYFVFFSDNFETGAPGWTSSTVAGWRNDWHVSTQRPYSGLRSFKCGENVSGADEGSYDNLCDSRLLSPNIPTIPANARLQFTMQIESEVLHDEDFPDSAFDGGIIEISANSGPFVRVAPDAGYNSRFTQLDDDGTPHSGPMRGQPCIAGFITTWVTHTIDLSAYSGQSIRVRFRFGSNSGSTEIGWYVDDVIAFTGQPLPQTPPGLVIRSNTVANTLTLTWQSTGAPSYIIRSSDSPLGPYNTVEGTTGLTSFTIPEPATLSKFYRVYASDGTAAPAPGEGGVRLDR